jgi:hypothetical protein
VKEYLVSQRIQGSQVSSYFIAQPSANAWLVQICVEYLLYITRVTGSALIPHNGFTFATYAAVCFPQHIESSEQDISAVTESLVLELLEPATTMYSKWVVLYLTESEIYHYSDEFPNPPWKKTCRSSLLSIIDWSIVQVDLLAHQTRIKYQCKQRSS